MSLSSQQARELQRKRWPQPTEEELTTGLMALAAWAGDCNAASRYLKAEKGMSVSPTVLKGWKVKHAPRYDKLREDLQSQLEQSLGHEMREVAAHATLGTREAVEAARKKIRKGEEADPARAAANLARVAQSQVDKLMTLTSRPQQHRDTRDVLEVVRGLVNMGVLVGAVEKEPVQIEDGEAEEWTSETDGNPPRDEKTTTSS
jgi:hypothetical protein